MSRAETGKLVKRRQSNEQSELKTDETSERQQKKLIGDAKKMKKSIRKIVRRTGGRDTDSVTEQAGQGTLNEAANDVMFEQWRMG